MSQAASSEPGPRPLGRPRRRPSTSERPAAEEILLQAGRLFFQKGYESTSTREIAEASGLQQASLFYYFPTKEDILAELGERSVRQSLQSMERVRATSWSPAAKLYRELYDSSANRLADPWDILATLLPAFTRGVGGSRIIAIAQDFGVYAKHTEDLVKGGVATGQFREGPLLLHLATVYGVISWPSIVARRADSEDDGQELAHTFDAQRLTIRARPTAAQRRAGALTPQEAAHHVAAFAIRALLADPDTLQSVVDEAMQD